MSYSYYLGKTIIIILVLISCRQVEILECYRQQQGKSPAEAEGEYLAVARWG